MKSFILACLLFSGSRTFQTTENFGIAYYQVPEGWQTVQNAPQVILESKLKHGKSCRIIISATEGTVVNTEESYFAWRKQKSGDYSHAAYSPVVRKENTYITALYSETSASNKDKEKSTFYVFSNRQESFSLQYLSADTNCDAVFRMFLDRLEVAEAVTEKTDKTNTKSKSKPGGKPRGRPRKNPA
jgi:uncharacterized protein YbdZ (MbtH family)